jgi:YD repeat-containing protein
MKKVWIVVLGFVFVAVLLNAGTQTDLQKRELKGAVHTLTEGTDTYTFNKAGNIETISNKYSDEYGEVCYTYNSKGQLTSSGDEEAGTSYTYNDKGLLVEEEYSDWEETSKTIYSYNAKNQITWAKGYSNKKLTGATEYAYDAAGNVSKESNYDKDNLLTGYSEMVYDANKNIVELRKYDAKGVLGDKRQKKYNAQNRLIEEATFTGSNPRSKRTLSYDAQGNQTDETFLDIKSNTTIKTTYKYTYDSHGNWTKKEKWEGGVLRHTASRTISYY